MSKKLLAAQICLLLAACSNPTDNSTSLNAGSDSDDSGDTDDTVTVIEDSDLVLPEQLDAAASSANTLSKRSRRDDIIA